MCNLESKNSDINSVPNWIYKYCINEISPILVILCHFSEELKLARITPVPKTCSQNSQIIFAKMKSFI